MPKSGPARSQVENVGSSPKPTGITLVNVDNAVAQRLLREKKNALFSEVFGDSAAPGYQVSRGDMLEISVWEAPPSMLFGGAVIDYKQAATTTRAETLPAQMVREDGRITVPFAGRIRVAGQTIHQIEDEIIGKFQGKANQPQVVVRVVRSPSANVTIIGDVASSVLMPITPKGERLLEALAVAGGVTQPVTRVSMQLSRANVTATMPLDSIIEDSRQNIPLKPGDVLTAMYQPWSFSVLGATGRNQEIPFEARGISLAQALARSGGLDDSRAAAAVFIYRFETPVFARGAGAAPASARGTLPVIYQVNLEDPAAMFITQNFPIQNHDVIYVANAPAAELEKFLRMMGLVLAPSMNVTNQARVISQ